MIYIIALMAYNHQQRQLDAAEEFYKAEYVNFGKEFSGEILEDLEDLLM